MKKLLVVMLLVLVSAVCFSIVKIYCDKCKKEMTGTTLPFKIDIIVGDNHQEVTCDICDKCFESLCKDLEKYNLKISSMNWKPIDNGTIYIAPNYQYQYKYDGFMMPLSK